MNGTPVSFDDSVFVTSRVGTLLIVDQAANTIYVLQSASFIPGTVFSSASDIGKLGTTNLNTGVFTPLLKFAQPKGLAFTSQLVGLIVTESRGETRSIDDRMRRVFAGSMLLHFPFSQA